MVRTLSWNCRRRASKCLFYLQGLRSCSSIPSGFSHCLLGSTSAASLTTACSPPNFPMIPVHVPLNMHWSLTAWAAAMRTGVVDGVELTVQVEQGDLLSLHLNQLAVVRFKLARLRYFDIFGHANLLDRSTILRRAVVVRQSAAKQDVPSVTCRRASRSAPP